MRLLAREFLVLSRSMPSVVVDRPRTVVPCLERLPEHLVEDGVEDGVHHGASVAQPGDHVEDPVANSFLALRAHRGQEIEDEEWRPEDYERKEHHSQHLGGLLLQPDDPAVARGVSGDHAGVPRVMRSHRLLTLQHAG